MAVVGGEGGLDKGVFTWFTSLAVVTLTGREGKFLSRLGPADRVFDSPWTFSCSNTIHNVTDSTVFRIVAIGTTSKITIRKS